MKALITGATSGIGMSIARKLRRRGWELILTGRNEAMLKQLKYELGDTEVITADLSDRNDVFKVYEFCKDKNIDLLVNNAGYGIGGAVEEIDQDEIKDSFDSTQLYILTLYLDPKDKHIVQAYEEKIISDFDLSD